MKRYSTLLSLLIAFYGAFAQQETFQFYRWNEVNHPFPKDEPYSSGGPKDSQGKTWYTSRLANGVKWKSGKDSVLVKYSNKHKAGYEYYIGDYIIDEMDTKLTLVFGVKYLNSKFYYDNYVVKHNSANQTTYVYPSEFGFTDTTAQFNLRGSIGGKVIISTTTSKFLWEGDHKIYDNPKGRTSYVSDKKNTVFQFGIGAPGITSFHSDGTIMQNRLAGKAIKGSYSAPDGSLRVYTTDGIYELTGKTEQLLPFPESEALFAQRQLYRKEVQLAGKKAEVVLTPKGFNVTEGTQSTTYLFASNSEVKTDSLSIPGRTTEGSIVVQNDSSIVITYVQDSAVVPYAACYYLFIYKNGVAKWHKKVDVHRLNINVNNGFAVYASQEKTYFYTVSDPLIQIKDTTVSYIPWQSGACYLKVSGTIADKDYLWLRNSGLPDTSKCVIARMNHDDYFVRGQVYYDANMDRRKGGTNEPWYSRLTLIVQPSGLLLFPDQEGQFAFKGEPSKTYTIKVLDSTRFSWINGYDKNTGYIGVKLKEEKPEASTFAWLPRARCSTSVPASFILNNTGVVPLEKVVVRLSTKKMRIGGDTGWQDTLKFTYASLPPARQMVGNYQIEWPSAQLTGETATLLIVTELYANGQLASRKVDSIQTVIRCSYDPNDKGATPVGIGEKNYTLKSEALRYQIRFENTGNDTAYHVVVKDTLPQHFDLSTFEIIGASHKMNAELTPSGVVVFHFNYIMLPDTGSSKEAANGYVTFRIKPKISVANNTLVCNSASIYFDRNAPILTQAVCNHLVQHLPDITTRLETMGVAEKGQLFPNPASETVELAKSVQSVTICNAFGEEVLRSNSQKMDISELPSGVYLLKIHYENGSMGTEKLLIVR